MLRQKKFRNDKSMSPYHKPVQRGYTGLSDGINDI
jgi:hypothetical protein